MNQELPPTITDLLKGINVEHDENKLFVLCGCLNLYMEAIRRCQGRILFHTGDVRAILDMAHTMIVRAPDAIPVTRVTNEDRELSSVEEEQVSSGIVRAVERRA